MKIISAIKEKVKAAISLVRRTEFKRNNTITAGILNEKLYVGPDLVQIDLTNRCNNSCIGCWLHSPFVSKDIRSLKQTIPREKAIQTINDLYSLGTKRILFSGGGEPTMHPHFEEIMEEVCKKQMECNIITNFNRINRKLIDKIISLEINEFFISLWASDKKKYKETHPNQKEESFEQLVESIRYFVSEKKRRGKGPRIILLNTISKANYEDVLAIAKLASRLEVGRIEFVMMDLIEGATDHLKLNNEEIAEVERQIREIEKNSRNRYLFRVDSKNRFVKKAGKTELWGFGRFKERTLNYFNEKGFDKNLVDVIPCYTGWIYTRIMANGDVIPCCKAARHPLGNINEKRFRDIWKGEKYHDFRLKAKNEKKSHPYFRKINCYKGCDNFIENERWHERINRLTPKQRKIIEEM